MPLDNRELAQLIYDNVFDYKIVAKSPEKEDLALVMSKIVREYTVDRIEQVLEVNRVVEAQHAAG